MQKAFQEKQNVVDLNFADWNFSFKSLPPGIPPSQETCYYPLLKILTVDLFKSIFSQYGLWVNIFFQYFEWEIFQQQKVISIHFELNVYNTLHDIYRVTNYTWPCVSICGGQFFTQLTAPNLLAKNLWQNGLLTVKIYLTLVPHKLKLNSAKKYLTGKKLQIPSTKTLLREGRKNKEKILVLMFFFFFFF